MAALEPAYTIFTDEQKRERGWTMELTAKQRQKFLDLLREDSNAGHITALRKVGAKGSKGHLGSLVDEDLREEIAEVRCESLKKAGLGHSDLIAKLAWIVHDDGNSSQLRAIQAAFGLHGIQLGQVDRVELTGPDGGPMEVTNPDVAAAIERFTSLADAAIRAATRSGAPEPPRRALPASTG